MRQSFKVLTIPKSISITTILIASGKCSLQLGSTRTFYAFDNSKNLQNWGELPKKIARKVIAEAPKHMIPFPTVTSGWLKASTIPRLGARLSERSLSPNHIPGGTTTPLALERLVYVCLPPCVRLQLPHLASRTRASSCVRQRDDNGRHNPTILDHNNRPCCQSSTGHPAFSGTPADDTYILRNLTLMTLLYSSSARDG